MTNVNAEAGSSSTAAAASKIIQQVEPVAAAKKKTFLGVTPDVASYFIAGGCAGATSRTVVSPLERLKIIQQVQPRGSDSQYKGVYRSLVRMWKEEGFAGYMRGNGINCLRIVPYSAVQFTTYEQLKKVSISHTFKGVLWSSSHGHTAAMLSMASSHVFAEGGMP
ncbi:hypothetical protein D9613_000227 [Agrocybe pediades]|uniref:Mitochondrial carrier protein n=1 Tax=Agrocybe pediades TaxID=84607 RepID=A0A8H4VSK3_9AGAR|nr:hypothetical protein D9613_000227 [Agrocybe pediades]